MSRKLCFFKRIPDNHKFPLNYFFWVYLLKIELPRYYPRMEGFVTAVHIRQGVHCFRTWNHVHAPCLPFNCLSLENTLK